MASLSQVDVPLRGASVSIVRRCELALSDVLQTKFGCTVRIQGVDLSRPTMVPEERFSSRLHEGLTVSVWKADLTGFPVDAVVNAANTRLQHYGGVALALSNAGGPEIQAESDDYILRNGALKTGEAIVTNAGNLPCKKIIHAVGPKLPPNPPPSSVSEAAPLLEKAVWHILAAAGTHRLQSVAIPAISSGLFNFPLTQCADIIVTTLKRHGEQAPRGCLPREVSLVNNDEASVREMERACRQILAHTPSLYSHAAGSHRRGAAPPSPTSPYTIQTGGVRLTLRKGKIEEQQTDVIVNTTSPELDLSVGQISGALLARAGFKMQKEIRERKPAYGPCVYVTKSYGLQCKQVYHTVCTSTKILSEAISACLTLAASNHHRSIAFPAIGTGNLGFSKEHAANIMTSSVVAFARGSQKTLDVHFVIYPPDDDTFKAFEREMRSIQGWTAPPSASHGFEPDSDFRSSAAPTPQITLSSSSDVTTHEASRWLSDLFGSSGSVCIRNNFVQYFGEREFRRLSRESSTGASIAEFFDGGCAGVTVRGKSVEDVVVAALRVEAMLCRVQEEFVKEEERTMLLTSTIMVSYERTPVDRYSRLFKDKQSVYRNHNLHIIRVEKVENAALKEAFELKGKRLGSSIRPRRMYQRIPAQFCSMVGHVGFQREYAPPDDAAYGEGIYFSGSPSEALSLWKDLADEEYLYLVEALVLTGRSAPGEPGLIVPPAVGDDPLVLYDSVSGGTDISVVFNGYQALPEYIVICKTVSTLSGSTGEPKPQYWRTKSPNVQ
ncbi:protein mono-ADP-ribosyltransferase PARP9 [Diretmus argenteus]